LRKKTVSGGAKEAIGQKKASTGSKTAALKPKSAEQSGRGVRVKAGKGPRRVSALGLDRKGEKGRSPKLEGVRGRRLLGRIQITTGKKEPLRIKIQEDSARSQWLEGNFGDKYRLGFGAPKGPYWGVGGVPRLGRVGTVRESMAKKGEKIRVVI